MFKPPVLPAKKGVKTTTIEPFHLTEYHKKEVKILLLGFFCLSNVSHEKQNVPPRESEGNDFKFHAKPAPKFEAPSVERKQVIPNTVPQTPKFSEAGKASLHSWRERRQRSRVGFSLTNGSVTGVNNLNPLPRSV